MEASALYFSTDLFIFLILIDEISVISCWKMALGHQIQNYKMKAEMHFDN